VPRPSGSPWLCKSAILPICRCAQTGGPLPLEMAAVLGGVERVTPYIQNRCALGVFCGSGFSLRPKGHKRLSAFA